MAPFCSGVPVNHASEHKTRTLKLNAGSVHITISTCAFPSETRQEFHSRKHRYEIGLLIYHTCGKCCSNQPHPPLWTGSRRVLAAFLLLYLMSRQLLPSQDWSFMSRWFIACSTSGSTFLMMFSSWWGSSFRLYTSTNDWGHKEEQTLSFTPASTLVRVSPMCQTRPCCTSLSANSQYWRLFSLSRVRTQA